MRTENDYPAQALEALLRELAGYYELLGLPRQRAEASARADFADELGGAAGLPAARTSCTPFSRGNQLGLLH
ncbi:MAG: hypothetical protein SFU85_08885 [Candidatus Methylacidiphilales bacterium]|nr:hypothetical protein [Candidatus Methylacidiphilales bacterium]